MRSIHSLFIGVLGLICVLAVKLSGADAIALLTLAQPGSGAVGLDERPDGKPLQIGGTSYARGLSTGFGIMEFELPAGCRSFKAEIGMGRGAQADGRFFVLLDDAVFYKGVQATNQAATSIELPCAGVGRLALASCDLKAELSIPGGAGGGAVWGDARLVMEGGGTVFLSDVLRKQGKLAWTSPARAFGRVDPEPETVAVTPECGTRMIERDWLMQAEGELLGERTMKELGWARQMAERILKIADAKRVALVRAELETLSQIEKRLGAKQVAAGGPAAADLANYVARQLECRADYNAVRRCKRAIMLQHPAIDFSEVLFVDNPYTSGTEWIHESRMRAGFMATPGGRLLALDGLAPSGRVRKLAPADKPAAFRGFDLSYDGRKVLFSMATGVERSVDKIYHLYEMAVDGSGVRQLTAARYNDIDPVYLADGNIAFLSDRANTYGGCAPWATQYTMARCNSAGRDIYLLSVGSEGEFSPSMLSDGRLIYTRWEYNDKALNRIQSLWTMNPDGTMSSTFYGNQSYFPDHLGEARSIPGTSLVVFNGMGHHDLYSGSIGVVDTREGRDNPRGLYKVTQNIPWAEGGDGPVKPKPYCDDYHVSGKLRFAQYKSPFPLSEDLFLVSVRTIFHDVSAKAYHQPSLFKLYLLDKYGNHELIYSGCYNVLYAQPVRKRFRPPVKPSMVQWPGAEKDGAKIEQAILYSADVYEGMPVELRGKGRFLRVLEEVQRTYTAGCVDGGGSPFGSGCNEALDRWKKGGNPTRAEVDNPWGDGAILAGPAIAISSNTRIKRYLGTVPLAKDGSFCFYAPPGKPIYFQLIDENGLVLQSMRSWVNLMPGEKRGCVGCHEGRLNSPAGMDYKLARTPDRITPPAWGVKTLSYVHDIQPIFNRNCGRCHQGEGKGREKLDLTLRPDPKNRWGGIFPEPYITLTCGSNNVSNYAVMGNPSPTIAGNFFIWALPYTTLEPMTRWSYRSRLINMLLGGKHHDVKLNEEDMGKLIVWVDTNCHFRGLRDVTDIDDPDPDWFVYWPNPPKLKSAPYVNHLYRQDEFDSQADRPTLRERAEELRPEAAQVSF